LLFEVEDLYRRKSRISVLVPTRPYAILEAPSIAMRRNTGRSTRFAEVVLLVVLPRDWMLHPGYDKADQ
jgi:hypothetical protein